MDRTGIAETGRRGLARPQRTTRRSQWQGDRGPEAQQASAQPPRL